jgi:hypothetical protein
MASVPPAKRPTSIFILAVLQFLVGGVGLIYETLNIATPGLLQAKPPTVPAAMSDLTAAIPFLREVTLAASVTGLVLSLVLIVDGVGLLRMKRWSYNLGVLYGWLSIAYQAGWLSFLILVAQPILLEGLSNIPLKPGELPAGWQPDAYRRVLRIAEIAGVVVTGLGLLYPIFVLLMLAVKRKAFRRGKETAEANGIENKPLKA